MCKRNTFGVETLASVYYGKKKNNREELLVSGGILIARIRGQAKNVSADLQRESVTECAHCSPDWIVFKIIIIMIVQKGKCGALALAFCVLKLPYYTCFQITFHLWL